MMLLFLITNKDSILFENELRLIFFPFNHGMGYTMMMVWLTVLSSVSFSGRAIIAAQKAC